MAYAMSGSPASNLMFLRGIPVEPSPCRNKRQYFHLLNHLAVAHLAKEINALAAVIAERLDFAIKWIILNVLVQIVMHLPHKLRINTRDGLRTQFNHPANPL